ncbi:leucine-rich repeat-containing G-protein coupled receptor 4-like [Anopheles albimanus]|uniref:leucine-rich repeat-containing G-protein coupled receptor 4-like n=1 Tax=Anopheles albimanus TaxID=7167 RepID=UPI00164092B6|nr:leucine-rich repeat-containing G-protein coupled receptor 4-like [Anopheles albimanus]
MLRLLFSYVPVVTVVGLMVCADVLVHAQCSTDYEFECYIQFINMTSDGFARLLHIFATTSYPSYTVQRLIVAKSSGAFLQRIGQLTNGIIYLQYNEPVFVLPEGNELIYVTLTVAPALRVFIAGRNDHLQSLRIENSSLGVIPATLKQLTQLQLLEIDCSPLTTLPLDMLAKNPYLFHVDLLANRIAQILPLTDPGAVLSVKKLSLTANRIVHLDLSVFEGAKDLSYLDLRNNRMLSISAGTKAGSLPNLLSLYLDGNRLSTFDPLLGLHAPRLTVLSLSENNFTEIPSKWEKSSALRYISLDSNRIRTFDFATVRSLKALESISLTENRIHTVRASPPVVELPLLQSIYLRGNALESFSLNGIELPTIGWITLDQNRLSRVPPVYRKYPQVRLFLTDNPIRCASLEQNQDKLSAYLITVSVAWEDYICPSKIINLLNIDMCCVG